MSQYLLSVHTVEGEDRHASMTPGDMEAFMERVTALEAEMRETGTLVVSGRLNEPSAATVVRMADGDLITTDGPFAESKEHIGGFYIIDAADGDAALAWAGKVVDAIGAPIEVRPFLHLAGA